MKIAIVIALLGFLQLASGLQQPINPELLEEASYVAEYGGKLMPVIDDPAPAGSAKAVTCTTNCPEPKHVELITPEFKVAPAPEAVDEEDDDGEYMTPELKTPAQAAENSCEPECPAAPEPVLKNGVRIVAKDLIGEDQNIAIEEKAASGSGHSTGSQGGIGSDSDEAVDNAAETGEGTTEVTVTTTKIGPESEIASADDSSEEVATEIAEDKTEGSLVERVSKLRKRRKHRN